MLEKLTQQEEQAMLAIWKTGAGFVNDFLEKMPDPQPHYNTFTSTIKNLVKKGYVAAAKRGMMYEYAPTVTEDQYKKQFMTGVVKDYFDNSYKQLVAFFAKEQKISEKELKEVLDMINRSKK